MRANSVVVILAVGLTLVIGLLALPFVYSPPQLWEYKIDSVSDFRFTEAMNAHGEDGWELIFARRARDSITESFSYEVIFKRQR